MPGIRRIKNLDKEDLTMKFIINELLKPEIRQALFDDIWGIESIGMLMQSHLTRIYGVFAEGKPEPIGIVFFTNVFAYRDVNLYAVVFDKSKRNQGVMNEVCPKIKNDFIKRELPHSVSAYVIGKNPVSEHFLEKLGFEKLAVKKKSIISNGKYKDKTEYYLLLEKEVQSG